MILFLRFAALALVALLLLSSTAPALADGVTASIGQRRTMASYRFFPPTGHSVSGLFLAFFDRYGGIDVFGYPLTEALEEDGRLVQYFQRHRMEYWPENPANWQVQLTLLGDLLLGPADPGLPRPADPAALYFPETGHSVQGPFRQFFLRHGGTIIFGYPTSEAYQEGEITVQRFQRARLEHRPQNPPAYQVEPGLLGVVALARRGQAAIELMKPTTPKEVESGWFVWGSWATDTRDFLRSKLANNEVAVEALDGAVLAPGQTYNFNRVLAVPGYVQGLGYGLNDKFVWMRAGGVCASATTFYRAAYNAGLPILSVYPHTLASYPPFGWDATVEWEGPDVVIRNDTGTQLRLRARLDRERHELLFWIEGRAPPDRTVVRRGPFPTGTLAYEVFRDIDYADGRKVTERRTVRYVGEPPPVPPEVLAQEKLVNRW